MSEPVGRPFRSVGVLPKQTAASPYFELARQSRCPFRGLLGVHFLFWPVHSLIRPLPNLFHKRLRALPLPAVHAPVTPGWSSVAGWVIFLPLDQRALFTAHSEFRLKACKPGPDPLREIRGIVRFLSAFID